jgi:hypothetical protein
VQDGARLLNSLVRVDRRREGADTQEQLSVTYLERWKTDVGFEMMGDSDDE